VKKFDGKAWVETGTANKGGDGFAAIGSTKDGIFLLFNESDLVL
jgi:hypothetical protein